MDRSLHFGICDLVDLKIEFESAFVGRPVVRHEIVFLDTAHESDHTAVDVEEQEVAPLRFRYDSSPNIWCMYTT